MGTNGKLAAALGAVVLTGIVGIAFQRSATMTHTAAAPAAEAAEVRPTAPDTLVVTAAGSGPIDEPTVAAVEALPGAARVDRYLSGTLPDGSPVIGAAPSDAQLVTRDGRSLSYRVVAGRPLDRAGAGQPAAVVGARWARTHQTVYEYQVSEMTSETHAPLVELAPGLTASVFGILSSGDTTADESVFVPLELAQTLLARDGAVDMLAVRPAPGADKSALEAELRQLGLRVTGSGA